MSKNEQKRVIASKKRAKNTNSYVCKICDYNTSRHSNYLRHIETKKHLEKHKKVLFSVKSVNRKPSFSHRSSTLPLSKSSKKKMTTTNNRKCSSKSMHIDKFYCELCDYKASQKSHYEKHLKTKKHTSKMKFFSAHITEQTPPLPTDRNNASNSTNVDGVTAESIIKDKADEIDQLKKQIYSIIENQNLIKKETDDIKMKSKQGQVIYNNNISINFFLDTYCSKAQPIQDFISNMSFKLGDIMRNNQLVENFISKKLLKGLEDMPVTERPIHCTDQKRKNFIVKDERDGWVKDTAIDNNSKLYTRVDQLHKKAYIDFYNEYDKENPLPHDGEKEQIKFNISSQIINQNDDTNKVIIRDIAKQVDIYDALGGVNEFMLENNKPMDTMNTTNITNTNTNHLNVECLSKSHPTSNSIPLTDGIVPTDNNNNHHTNYNFNINITDSK